MMIKRTEFTDMMRMLLLCLTLVVPLTHAEPVPPSPYDSVKETTDALLAKLVEIKPLYESDSTNFFAEVKVSLEPVMDFNGFARGVMAKYYRRASPEQIERFTQVFEDALIQTYAKALVEFDNQKVEVKSSGHAKCR